MDHGKNCSEICFQYGVLLNLLDNYIPLALCSYSILFKLNRFDDYFGSILTVRNLLLF